MWVEIAAFLGAGAWAVYTFVYQTHIAPLLESPHEIISGKVTRIGQASSGFIERVDVTMSNNGKAALDTAGLAIDLYGRRGASPSPRSEMRIDRLLVSESSAIPGRWEPLGSYSDLFSASVLGMPETHIVLYPGDSAQIQFLALVPRSRFAVLRLSADVIFVRYPQGEKVADSLKQQADGSVVLHSTQAGGTAYRVVTDWYFSV